MSAFNPAYV